MHARAAWTRRRNGRESHGGGGGVVVVGVEIAARHGH